MTLRANKVLRCIRLACATALPGATADAQDPAQAAYGVEIYEHRIPLPDGVRLAADLCLS